MQNNFIYVKDVADALVKINDSNIGNEIFNISTNTQKNINELFETLKNVTNYNKEPCHTNSRVGDIKDSVLDNSKLCENFKYNKSSFEDGLLKTVNYLMKIK